MKALVAYESMYGNTAAIGTAIATALRARGLDVLDGSISDILPIEAEAVDLLVVGGPTHAHGMSRASTRRAAADDEKNTYAYPAVSPGLREWIDGLPSGRGRLGAAFDTRIDKAVILTGSAAKGIARRLERRGYRLPVGPECFLVSTDNRLVDGELDHAASWGTSTVDTVAAATR